MFTRKVVYRQIHAYFSNIIITNFFYVAHTTFLICGIIIAEDDWLIQVELFSALVAPIFSSTTSIEKIKLLYLQL